MDTKLVLVLEIESKEEKLTNGAKDSNNPFSGP